MDDSIGLFLLMERSMLPTSVDKKADREWVCPHCKYITNAVSCITPSAAVNTEPSYGDFTLCASCASILAFDGNMDLVPVSLIALSLAPYPLLMELYMGRKTLLMIPEAVRQHDRTFDGNPWRRRTKVPGHDHCNLRHETST